MLATLPLGGVLADGVRFLVVNAKDGTNTTFALADEPRVSCKSGELTVVSKGTSFALSLAEVASYAFSESLAGYWLAVWFLPTCRTEGLSKPARLMSMARWSLT